MLTKNPNKVYAIDLSFNQIACTELKKIAYKYLEYNECMQLIGVFDCDNRIEIYHMIKDKLTKSTKKYFDENIQIIKKYN